jgi:Ca2+-transporting ATPase
MNASPPARRSWEKQTVPQTLAALESLPQGLTEPDVESRRRRFGPNTLIEKNQKGPWRILWDQWTSTMVVVMLVAAVLSFVVGDSKDAGVILAIVVLNTALGFFQEHKAEKSLAALKKMAVPRVRVRRGGRVAEIPSSDLVPGDIVLIEAGNAVPADGRFLETANLRVQESALTGESEPVDKTTEALTGENLPLGDQRNRAFMGTVTTYGHGAFIVTETGMATELGRVAALLQSSPPETTPLQRRLDKLGKQLALVAVVIVALVFLLGLARGEGVRLMFLTAVSLAVAAVPEGLPAVVTIALALGAQRMLKRRALIRKLPAVETLGSVNIICSDKTGTLTENRMTITVLDVAGHRLTIGEGADGETGPTPAMKWLLIGGTLCNDAVLEVHRDDVRFLGDPTEGAFLMAAWHEGLAKPELDRLYPRLDETPFDSVRKRMTTLHEAPGAGHAPHGPAFFEDAAAVAFSKGAVASVLAICDAVWTEGRREPLSPDLRKRIEDANDALAGRGMRVLGVAFRGFPSRPVDARAMESGLVFLGLVGMIDPPRPEVKEAVALCRRAGIRPLMITGDHPLTAQHIAQQLGLSDTPDCLTGSDLDVLTDGDLEGRVKTVSVFARVSPEHKLRIVAALQKHGFNVAMTGDGVNDAPALKRADIGVAMGLVGTDVAKESADMVLLDDNFTTIVAAIEEGRVIYDNIRKFMRYLLTTNFAEILVMAAGPLVGLPLPLLPLQILWINLVTDGLPALALGLEPGERHIMDRPPVRPDEGLFARGLGLHVLWVGLWMAGSALAVAGIFWRREDPHWQTTLFTALAFMQMAHVLAIRSERDSLFRQGLRSNPWLLGAVLSTLALQGLVVYVPFFQRVFGTRPLGPGALATAALLAAGVFVAVEIEKALRRRKPV